MPTKPEKKTIKFSYVMENTGKIIITQNGEYLLSVNSLEEYDSITDRLKNRYRSYTVLIDKPD